MRLRRQARVGIADAYGAEFEFQGQTGLALGLGAGVGLALAVAALELLAGVDGGEVGQLLLARDLVGGLWMTAVMAAVCCDSLCAVASRARAWIYGL